MTMLFPLKLYPLTSKPRACDDVIEIFGVQDLLLKNEGKT